MKSLFSLFLFIPFFSFCQTDTLIKDHKAAISMAEPVLFKTYGKRIIKREKPYDSNLKDGLWYITGSLKKRHDGGVFLIVINSKSGEVIKLTHSR